MEYCKNYCVEKGISVSKLNEVQRILYYIAENMMLTNSISEEGYRNFQIAIKALEQKPFINKDCVSEGVCHEDKIKVLDKIRNEVKALTDGAEPEHVWNVDVLAIIDKYKAESEE